jgi:superfamily I DNA/RNA helicase
MPYKADRYQEAVIDQVGSRRNLVVNAVAGSGKSSTLEAMAARFETTCAGDDVGQIIAFSKGIATAMTERLTKAGIRRVVASTTHSLAFSAVRRAFGNNVKVESDKGRWIVADLVGQDFKQRTLRMTVERLVDLCKVTLTEPTKENLDALVDHYGIEMEDLTEVEAGAAYDYVPLALDRAANMTSIIDFNDMVWFVARWKLPLPKVEVLMVDECQDLNAVQRHIVLAGRAAQTVCVGDIRQAIFGFAGADVESMRRLEADLQAMPMPMSVCYRCPTSHLDLARQIVPQIEARPDAPKGEVSEASLDAALRTMKDGDLVMCRVNAPLAEIAMALIRSGRKASIKGRDLGKSILALCDRWMRGTDLGEGFKRLNNWQEREITKLTKAGKEKQIDAITDRVATLVALSDGCHTVEELRRRVERIFHENPSEGVVCSSVHRAKGLEAERTYIYRPELLPWPKARMAWEVEQEMNLKYVALTRAKQSMTFVSEK